MVARTPNSERKMHDELPDVNVAAEFYALYDIREVLGKLVFTVSLEFIRICCYAIEFAFASCFLQLVQVTSLGTLASSLNPNALVATGKAT